MKTKEADFIWFDGKIVKWEEALVPVTTHALHYGTGVFEGIRGYYANDNLFIFRLREHVERLFRSASLYSIKINHTVDEIIDGIVNIIRENKIKESCYIRPLVFVGNHGIDLNLTEASPTHVVIIVFPFARYFHGEGLNVCVSSWRRINDSATPPLAKASGNYLNSILATQECKRNGYDEAIMLDYLGNVSEAPGENIFVIRNNMINTPDLASSTLEGITRDTIIQISNKLGYKVVERPISRTELYLADEIFLTGTAAEITGVISVDKKNVSKGFEGNITKKIRETYTMIVSGEYEDAEFQRWLTKVW
ncbi:MAG: branched chain amino acid aminotransferase [Nitrososphaeraceae archaeon]|nr:branched chain amino acid aminotransferase [Nitrososphaeraceae archaeon]